VVLELPERIVTEVVDAPPEVAAKMPPTELDPRFTVVFEPTLTGVPKAFWTWTVMGPRVALLDAAPDTAVDVITNLLIVKLSEILPAQPSKDVLPSVVAAWPPKPLSKVEP